MKLLLIRHGDASSDDSRALTEIGRQQHAQVSEALRQMGIVFDRLLTSPLLRARQSAEITARVTNFRGAVEEMPALGDDFTVEAVLERLAVLPVETTVVCVGHEPHLSRLAAALCTPDGRLSLDVKKSGVVGVQSDGHPVRGRATLLFVFRPEELIRLTASP